MFEKIDYRYEGDYSPSQKSSDIRTMKSFIESGEVVAGRIFVFANGESIIIGDATPQREPTTSDGGIGWDYSKWENRIVVRIADINKLSMVYEIINSTGDTEPLSDVLETTLKNRLC